MNLALGALDFSVYLLRPLTSLSVAPDGTQALAAQFFAGGNTGADLPATTPPKPTTRH